MTLALRHFQDKILAGLRMISLSLMYTVNSEIFANSVKTHICNVKNLRQRHDLPISVNDSNSDFANS